MRLLRYRDGTGVHLGALQGADRVLDLTALSAENDGLRLGPDMVEFIAGGDEALLRAGSLIVAAAGDDRYLHPLDGIEILAPLDPPAGNVLAIGRNYREHAEEVARGRGTEITRPTVFTKAQSTVNGPYADVSFDPAISRQIDWEVEVGVIIGRAGKNIARERALEHVFGYTVINDVSARDIQYGWGGQFFKGKSLDGFCPMGPWILTADEAPSPPAFHLQLRVNGQVKQDAHTGSMIFPIDELIAELSLGMTLLPGNIIATGTPSGVGVHRDPPEFLQDGDLMESEITEIGVLRNRIVARSEAAQ
ncbi:MAG: fumarylacetoacetate hydrolase family protein [Chloroflexota bacterium]